MAGERGGGGGGGWAEHLFMQNSFYSPLTLGSIFFSSIFATSSTTKNGKERKNRLLLQSKSELSSYIHYLKMLPVNIGPSDFRLMFWWTAFWNHFIVLLFFFFSRGLYLQIPPDKSEWSQTPITQSNNKIGASHSFSKIITFRFGKHSIHCYVF